jgi:hypothetical protein
LSTVNFENIIFLSTDLHLSYDATTTLKNVVSLKLLQFIGSAIFLSSTVVSLEIRNKMISELPLALCHSHILKLNLSYLSQSLKSVLLENLSSTTDLTPLGNIEKVELQFCHELVNVNGLGENNKIVAITSCRNIRDLSALKTVPRVIVHRCADFAHCEDLNQVRYLTIECVSTRADFSGLKREKGGRVHRLELLNCDATVAFKGLNEIPFLKITSASRLQSLEGIGGPESKIIIIEPKYESLADRLILANCYSKTFYKDVNSGRNVFATLTGSGGKENNIIILEAKYESLADKRFQMDCYEKRFYYSKEVY